MHKARLEAFSDGVIAIIITIMVLELKITPALQEHHPITLRDLAPSLPVFLSYVLSFVYVGIYWNNHHHLLHCAKHVSGSILWANLHLLFWLSLFPVTTALVGEHHGQEDQLPVALYGFVLLMAALAYYLLQLRIMKHQGQNSLLAQALGSDWKGKLSPILYLAAIPLAYARPWIALAIYVLVALLWLVPDRRLERALATHEPK